MLSNNAETVSEPKSSHQNVQRHQSARQQGRRVVVGASVAGAFAAALLSGPAAHAYMDPGTGSYFFQMLIAMLMGGALSVRLFWRRITSVFRRGSSDADAPEDAPSESPSSKE